VTGVLPFIIRRLLAAIPVLFVVSLATFMIGRYAPGDPITVRAGPRASDEQIEQIKQNLGLNDPILVQYARYMGKLLRGDLGESYQRPGYTVWEIMRPKMWVSFQLNILPFLLVYLMGIPIGIYMALKRGHWQDPTTTVSLIFVAAIPTFVLAPLLQWIFALRLGWLPVGGWDGIFSTRIIMPTFVLTIGGLAGIARLTRISVIQVLGEDFIRTARAKGLSEWSVIGRHTLRNALLPLTNGIVLGLIYLYTGTLFVELLFGIPGLGRETFASIGSRDYDFFMAITMISAAAFILANIILDIVYTIVDPRIRTTGGEL
jgi:ABC-type dipeptide/oligopeptide/nickel transport system permease component